jgi:hypothetical membrane protein
VKRIPGWAVVSAFVGPVLLIGGWTVAAARQPSGYDPVRDTISSLASLGAVDRWIMTWALVGLGMCYIVDAAGLSVVRRTGRVVLAAGGAATVLVGVFAQPVQGNSVGHTVAAALAFTALASWPLCAANDRLGVALLTWRASVMASVVMAALVVWFLFEVHGSHRGLAERLAAGSEAIWPLAVVVAVRAKHVQRGLFAPSDKRAPRPGLTSSPCSSWPRLDGGARAASRPSPTSA